jgi:glutamate-1-semialdehyde 2,1-aminomutase
MVKSVNKHLFDEAKKYIAGGVNSPVRSFRAVGGAPIFVKAGRGCKIYGEDRRVFTDYCLSWGALILGHADPRIVKAVKESAENGTTFGTSTKPETELAKLIITAIPSIKRIRLTSSGTEAVMSAIRLARAYTRRDKIIKFEGSYHGHADYLLDCTGVPKDFMKYTIVLPYNSLERTEETVKRYQKEIAAIIVEPVAANMGVVLPKPGFLEGLRNLCDKYNIVLIFDEVITGFRLAYGGAQEMFKVEPDLTCLGKIVGGGLPCAAYGGKKEIMKLVAPEGDVYQAGTLAGNPLAVRAGIATLNILRESDPYEALNRRTEELCKQARLSAQENRIRLKVNCIGSVFSFFFSKAEIFKVFFHDLLKKGIYLSPSGLEANFLSTAHRPEDVGDTIKAVDMTFKNLRRY